MLFLGPIYRIVVEHYAERINHFPLIELIFYSLDKTILYFILLAILRVLYLKFKRRPWRWGHELLLGLFTFYLLLLLALTVFRGIYFPWQIKIYWHRSPAVINWTVLTETLKLQYARSQLDFLYNFYGNILWFIPFGFLWPLLRVKHRPNLLLTLLAGALLSAVIETLQFFLATGVTDIDDLIFNTVGAVIGYCLYLIVIPRRIRRKKVTAA
ncbi:VanZ family protein [Lapidilactobacillus luobeiensis]|uniref:VanZ family protein n=1 Tax=Lapidilactobacillus luobeiensis TaxID=2950371 RepID=UPI0021C27434|nr:VanZ family protein [Lapidilactobacillus luobeiensis]